MKKLLTVITVILLITIPIIEMVPVENPESSKTSTDYQFNQPGLISIETLIKLLFLFAAFYFA